MNMSFEQFMGLPSSSSSSSVASSSPKGVAVIDNVIDYKNSKGTISKVYQVSVDDHTVAVYKNGVPTGETKRVVDLWVYPESANVFMTNSDGVTKEFKPNKAIKDYIDERMKNLSKVRATLKDFKPETIKEELGDFLKDMSHKGCFIANIKNDKDEVIGYKTCMVVLRLIPMENGDYGLKRIINFKKRK